MYSSNGCVMFHILECLKSAPGLYTTKTIEVSHALRSAAFQHHSQTLHVYSTHGIFARYTPRIMEVDGVAPKVKGLQLV